MTGPSALLFTPVRMPGGETQGNTHIVVSPALSSAKARARREMSVNMLMVFSSPGFILLNTALVFARTKLGAQGKCASLLTNLKSYARCTLPQVQPCLLLGLCHPAVQI